MKERDVVTWKDQDGKTQSFVTPLAHDVFEWLDENGQKKTIKIMGHRILVRRMETPRKQWIVGDESNSKCTPEQLAIVEAAVKTWQKETWAYGAECLAIGAACSEARTCRAMNRYLIPPERRIRNLRGRKYFIERNIVCPIVPGDVILCPETSSRNMMWRGITGSADDCLIDISEVLGYIPWESLRTGTP